MPLSTTSSQSNNVPLAQHVDIDSSQNTAWQKQRSVRHVDAAHTLDGGGSLGPTYGTPDRPNLQDRTHSARSQFASGASAGQGSHQVKDGAPGVFG